VYGIKSPKLSFDFSQERLFTKGGFSKLFLHKL